MSDDTNFEEAIALVVEDLPDTQEWLCTVLRQTFTGVEVRAFSTLTDARGWLGSAAPEQISRVRLALVDLGLPDGSGIDLIPELVDHCPAVVPIVATIYDDDEHLFDAIAAGAQGYLIKNQEQTVLAHYLRRIERGEPTLSPSIARRMFAFFRDRPGTKSKVPDTDALLTPREMEVLALLGVGSRVPEVAYRLGLTEHTVATYVKTICRKLKISSRAEAALEASQRGLI
ncbi:LuxR C-terminal-related transcriptional regulator [Microvirga sp. GCM10011540]|uniref:LuxR C-terminal-related transcriptional regulator n=1 Tax=Microvirga sp. GCM10011540 TaxID=3317338 RepID=UPI00360E57CA